MLKNKRTRVLLYILGVVLVVAIGVGIWAVATGRIKNLADTTATTAVPGPPIDGRGAYVVNGQIIDTSGAVQPHVTVALNRYDPSTKKYSIQTAVYTDAQGKYQFDKVWVGFVYKLYVYDLIDLCHKEVESATFSGTNGITKTINLQSKKYPSITGKLTYKDGSPVLPDGDGGSTSQVMVLNASLDDVFDPTPPAPYLGISRVKILDGKGNYEIKCLFPSMTTYIVANLNDGGMKLIKAYRPVPWAGAVLNITLPYNKPAGMP